jgi:hypothetical protein
LFLTPYDFRSKFKNQEGVHPGSGKYLVGLPAPLSFKLNRYRY